MKIIIKSLQPFIFLFFGTFLLWISFKDIDLVSFKEVLKHIPLECVLLSMLLGYLAFVFRGLRWALLINTLGYKPKKMHLIHSIAFGYLFNSFIPRSGEIMRCTAVNRIHKIPVAQLFGHVILERFIDFVILGLWRKWIIFIEMVGFFRGF